MIDPNDFYAGYCERTVARAVNSVLGTSLNPDGIYEGKTKPPFHVTVARAVVFYILHNVYGMKYSQIASRSGITATSVMRCTRSLQDMVDLNPDVCKVLDETLRTIYQSKTL